MVDAGIARKVDFGEGRSRFEPSYRHPRHFHLVCNVCHRSSEFLSSDIEALVEEIAAARNFEPAQTVVQVFGTCEECRTGTQAVAAGRRHDRAGVRARRAAHRHRDRAQRPASSTRAPPRSRPIRAAAACSRGSPRKRSEHLGTLEQRYASCSPRIPQLESRPTFLFFKGAANGIFAEGAEKLRAGVDDQQALLIGIRCERGSHKFFKRYGERFEDSEGKQIFLEFADEERAHRDLLIANIGRSARSAVGAPGRQARAGASAAH